MRRICFSPILGVLLLTGGPPAVAQVTVNLGALQALPERPTPAPAPYRVERAPRPAPATTEASPSRAPTTTASAAPHSPATGTTPAPAPAPAAPAPPATQPALPDSVPAVASIPPVAPPTETAPPPPAPIVSATAPTKAEPASQGLRLLFGAGSSDLSPDSAASLKQLAAAAPQSDATTFNVAAYAPGNRDDPSTARRLSLARAMAVRNALVSSGVASARIYVRALGDATGGGPADRVDISVMGANADSQAQAAPK